MKPCGAVVKTTSILGLQAGLASTGAPTAAGTSRMRWLTYFAYLLASPAVKGQMGRCHRAIAFTMRVGTVLVSMKRLIVACVGLVAVTVMLSWGSANGGFWASAVAPLIPSKRRAAQRHATLAP